MFDIADYKKYLDTIGNWELLKGFRGCPITKESFIDSLCQYDKKPYELVTMSRASFSKYVTLVFQQYLTGKPQQAAPAKYLLHGYGFRRCSFCKSVLPISAFYSRHSKANWDNLRNDCKNCEFLETQLKQNKDSINRKAKKYRDNNKDKIKEYRLSNSEKINSYTAKRRAKIRNQIGNSYSMEQEFRYRRIITYFSNRYKEKYVLDHYIAIANGGLHEPSNWQIITEKENLHKNRANPTDFYSSQLGLWFLNNKKGIRKYYIQG